MPAWPPYDDPQWCRTKAGTEEGPCFPTSRWSWPKSAPRTCGAPPPGRGAAGKPGRPGGLRTARWDGLPGMPRRSAMRIEEAAGIYRELAAVRPDAFLPNLAMSLNNQSNHLGDLGRRLEALAAIEEAAGIYRQLAAARPDAFLPNLATSLNNQSIHLASLGRREEGRAAIEEAAGIYRQLAAARPDAFLPNLATSLRNLADVLETLGRDSEAVKARTEADAIRASGPST